ncbi:reductase [Arthrobacter sp. MYb227]|uniref:NAD-dependent epimerase/dehydratase family protein n=1 Tax=Arthrobacter sp. MYb227 TaxID=1848601 RepID=UPI000CFDA8E5|nr:NAD-dependent epimerase/dehydratase family protein [Arthrobacter sp. MYb227]PQZ93676.1 reductase [Arthrobacter sp. MYb227]
MTRTLILGGTAWLGRELAKQLIAKGVEVTCLARGESGKVPNGAKLLQADRRAPAAYDRVKDLDWDEVIELSYEPEFVTGALDNLAERAKHWTLVSSVSVYASNQEPGAGEYASLVEPTDLEDYAQAKVAAEYASTAALGERLLIARPGLIVGPGDTSDRFSYWVSRLALAGHEDVLVPDVSTRFVQFIDVRDLASWLVKAGDQGLAGTFNVVGQEHQFADFLQAVTLSASYSGEFVTATDQWLQEHDVKYWAGPYSLPLWLPNGEEGFAQRSSFRYVASGGSIRPLNDTLGDVLSDERTRGLERTRRSGLSRTEELALLQQFRAESSS